MLGGLMYLVTVIIPVYNAEKYLKRAINSVINQTIGFENIELILIDDNSTDSSKDIILDYSNKYSNIKSFFLDTNHGFPGYGRNVGMDNATSDYIMFMDNDDEYEYEYCERAYNAIKYGACDVAVANYKIVNNTTNILQNNFSTVSYDMDCDNNLKLINLDKLRNIVVVDVWAMIFKKSIIKENNITFIEEGFNEDSLFLYNYFYYAEKLVLFDYFGYTHYRHGDNLSHYSSKVTLGFINSYYDILNFVEEKYDDVDKNYLFKDKIETTLVRIIYSSDQRCLLEELYDFEMKINFNSSLDHYWSSLCNKFVLKRKFSIVIIIFKFIRILKIFLDLLRKIKYSARHLFIQ